MTTISLQAPRISPSIFLIRAVVVLVSDPIALDWSHSTFIVRFVTDPVALDWSRSTPALVQRHKRLNSICAGRIGDRYQGTDIDIERRRPDG
jgi:hypothetical protein